MIQMDRDRSGPPAPDAPLAALADEQDTYRRRLPELLGTHDGRFVLIKGHEVIGVFDDRAAALRDGYRRFGAAPFLVRQVATAEPTVYLPNVTP